LVLTSTLARSPPTTALMVVVNMLVKSPELPVVIINRRRQGGLRMKEWGRRAAARIEPAYLSIDEASACSGLSEAEARRGPRAGELRAFGRGRRVLLSRVAIHAWIEGDATRPTG